MFYKKPVHFCIGFFSVCFVYISGSKINATLVLDVDEVRIGNK